MLVGVEVRHPKGCEVFDEKRQRVLLGGSAAGCDWLARGTWKVLRGARQLLGLGPTQGRKAARPKMQPNGLEGLPPAGGIHCPGRAGGKENAT